MNNNKKEIMFPKIDEGLKRREKLEEICKQFIEEQRITCAETVHQTDRVIINAYEFIERICECVGYYKDKEEE